MVKNPPTKAGDIRDVGSILGSGRSPGGGHGNPLQSSCLENPMDRGAWQAIVHKVAKSWTQLKQLSTCKIYIYIYVCVYVCVYICMYVWVCIWIYIYLFSAPVPGLKYLIPLEFSE